MEHPTLMSVFHILQNVLIDLLTYRFRTRIHSFYFLVVLQLLLSIILRQVQKQFGRGIKVSTASHALLYLKHKLHIYLYYNHTENIKNVHRYTSLYNNNKENQLTSNQRKIL